MCLRWGVKSESKGVRMTSTNNYETVLFEKSKGIGTITLNRPDRLNALNDKMGQELIGLFTLVDRDDEIRVVMITGVGRAFSAGADIKERLLGKIEQRKKGVIDDITDDFNEKAPLALARVRKPVIAAINGLAVGWGCSLSLGCDIRIASEEARFSLPFTRVGLCPEMGSSYYLPHLVGIGKACELVFTGRMIDAKEAKEIGLVNQIVPVGQLMQSAYEIAESIAKSAPLAMRVSKRTLYQGLTNDLPVQVKHESFAINYLRGTKDHEEAARAFLDKREPIFEGY